MLSELSLTPQTILLFISVVVALLSGLLALLAAAFAQSYATKAKRSLELSRQSMVFSSLDRAGHLLVNNPYLLISVHGMNPALIEELGEDEAASVAYLFLLINGFRQMYEDRFQGNYAKMVQRLKKRPSALNRILQVKANQRRLPYIAAMYSDDVNQEFIQSLYRLVEHENAKKSA